MVKSNLHGRTNKLDILTDALKTETKTQRWHGWFCKKEIYIHLPPNIYILYAGIAYLTKFRSEFSQSANEAEFCRFPRSPALYFLSLSLSCWLSFALTCNTISLPYIQLNQSGIWGASLPINYHPNQCRGLWYRIICQISADGWGQVPLCHRPYPHGNLCSGWALLTLPNLLMASHCALQDCSPAAWYPRLLMYKHLSLTDG